MTASDASNDRPIWKNPRFDFHGLSENLRFGTASDRYAGWLGQVYSPRLENEVTSRRKKLGKNSFEERLVPVSSTADFFNHFDVLEVDFTYYRPLVDVDGTETSSLASIRKYLEYAPDTALFLLKVPRTFFSRWLRTYVGGKAGYIENADYLSLTNYLKMFHEPATSELGSQLAGVIFEQEYQRKGDSPTATEFVDELDDFFSRVPRSVPLHIELRSGHLLVPEYFDWLETCGIGHVFSHWTWLPPIRKQWSMSGGRFTSTSGEAVVRLLTPLRMTYADAYADTTPFDRVVPGIADSPQAQRMVDDTAALAFKAIEQGKTLNIIANNRAWGNAPELSRTVADRIMAEMRKRAQERP
jgi:uncharacterized protein YecE (DUF72 family)